MTNYTITVKPYTDRSFAPPAWLEAVKNIDRDAEIAQLDDDDNGNIIFEVESTADLSTVKRARGVVSVEQA